MSSIILFLYYTEEKVEPEDNGRLRCETFDIDRVLQHGAHLMGSEGKEYDLDEEPLNVAGIYENFYDFFQLGLNRHTCPSFKLL